MSSNSPYGTPTKSKSKKRTNVPASLLFKPAAAPSPSRSDIWKHDLGFEDSDDDITNCLTHDDDLLSLTDDEVDDLPEDENSTTEVDRKSEAEPSLKSAKSVLEVQVLEIELCKKEKQKEELIMKLKAETDKANNYKNKLLKTEQQAKSRVKILKKSYDQHMSEKSTLITTMQEFINEQESRLAARLEQRGGEDSEVNFNMAKSVRGFVDQITQLQEEKVKLNEVVSKRERELTEVNGELKQMKTSVEERYVSKEKYTKLQDDYLNLEVKHTDSMNDMAKLADKENDMNRNNILITNYEQSLSTMKQEQMKMKEAHDEQVRQLKKNIEQLRSELTHKERDHVEAITKTENDMMELKKELRESKNKYADLAFTPPKIQVKTVVDQAAVQKLEEVSQEKLNLEFALKKIKRELEDQVKASERQQKDDKEGQERLSSELRRKDDEINTTKGELSALQSELNALKEKSKEDLRQFKKEIASKESEINNLQSVIRNKEEEAKQIQAQFQSELQQREDQLQSTIADYEKQQAVLKETLETRLREAVAATEEKCQSMQVQLEAMRQLIRHISHAFTQVKVEQRKMKREMNVLRESIKPALKDIKIQLIGAVEDINTKTQILIKRYKREMALRKKLHNEVVELKGNIRVFCRVRPSIKEDGSGKMAENIVKFDQDDDQLLYVSNRGTVKQFEMDRVFKPESTQIEVFDQVSSLVTSCLDGFNVCIFAYGQTGSGKTFTMEGPGSNPGINQRALRLLFKESDDSQDWEFTITVSVVEIYNEMLRDLLGDDPTAKLDIKQGKEGMFVPGLNVVRVNNVDEVNEVFALGHRNRITATTDMNEHSSRSHSILMVTVYGVNKNTRTKITGKMNLVDLAGSERVSKSGAEGMRMKEAQNINKSLSGLGDVIHSLKNKNSHVPYRNTKLTYLLQDSLGGDSKTLMVVQISPAEKNAGETVCSLNFAQRVRAVELGQATKRVEKSKD